MSRLTNRARQTISSLAGHGPRSEVHQFITPYPAQRRAGVGDSAGALGGFKNASALPKKTPWPVGVLGVRLSKRAGHLNVACERGSEAYRLLSRLTTSVGGTKAFNATNDDSQTDALFDVTVDQLRTLSALVRRGVDRVLPARPRTTAASTTASSALDAPEGTVETATSGLSVPPLPALPPGRSPGLPDFDTYRSELRTRVAGVQSENAACQYGACTTQAHDLALTNLHDFCHEIGTDLRLYNVPCAAELQVARGASAAKNLDPEIFHWQPTKGVQKDIPRDGQDVEAYVIYGAASQTNGTEAGDQHTPLTLGDALGASFHDWTQGPLAQRQFAYQFEAINGAAHLGLNFLAGLVPTEGAVQNGYLTPQSTEILHSVRDSLVQNWRDIAWPCMSSVPTTDGFNCTQNVDLILGAAPAGGDRYDATGLVTGAREGQDIQYYMARSSYGAQFARALDKAGELADAGLPNPVVLKPAGMGMGAFRNDPAVVAQAFKDQALEFQQQLEAINAERRAQGLLPLNVRVDLQVYIGEVSDQTGAWRLAQHAGLPETAPAE